MRTLEEISKELYHSLVGLTLPMNLEALREELGEALKGQEQTNVEEGAHVLPKTLSFAAYERACIVRALQRSRGSRVRTARVLKISMSGLYRKLTKFNIQ